MKYRLIRQVAVTGILSVLACGFKVAAQDLANDSVAEPEIPVFSRGLDKPVSFVPKGQWITGISVSYQQASADNYQFLILEKLSGDGYTFKISPMALYAFKDNLAAGGRFSYSRTMTRVDDGDLVLDSETSYDIDHLYSISHSYHAIGVFRNYISLGGSSRFGIFNEVQLQVGGGQSKLANGTGESLTGTYERTFGVDVGVAPGFIMFLSNYSALEVNVGVLGFSYTDVHSTTDQIYRASRSTSSANFKINLFSITFGVAFYL